MASITLPEARTLVSAATKKAEEIGQPMNIADGKVMIFAGGLPLMHGDEVIGAIGGSGEQDQQVAEAGAAALR